MSLEDRNLDRNAGRAAQDDRDVILVGNLAQQRRLNRARWGMLLVVYMRLLAALWLTLGLLYWTRILSPGETPLDALPFDVAGAIVFFAVGNLLAATGLWMAAPWGGALWLVTLAAEMAAVALMPAYFAGGSALLGAYALLAVLYFILTWLAAVERNE